MTKKRKISMTLLSVMLAGLLAGCAGGQLPQNQQQSSMVQTDGSSTDREAELQAEVDALREEIDALKKEQTDQTQSQTDQSQSGETQSQTGQDTASQGQASQSGTTNSNTTSARQGNCISPNVAISMEEAKSIALARVQGASEQNMSIKLDYDDGWYVYEGEIMYDGMEYEFDIDANSGTILKWEQERW